MNQRAEKPKQKANLKQEKPMQTKQSVTNSNNHQPSTACAGDMLLEALVSSAGVTLGQVATAMDIELRNVVIRAEGDPDFRGPLAFSKDVPVGLQGIRLHFDLDAEATEEQLAMLIRLTQRYCVVARTLKPVMAVTFSSYSKAA
jgi:uncharacterized OsmC-like protein